MRVKAQHKILVGYSKRITLKYGPVFTGKKKEGDSTL